MLARISLVVFSAIIVTWFLVPAGDVISSAKPTGVGGRPAMGSAAPGKSSASAIPLFGSSANPFGRLDCDLFHQSTACNPDQMADEELDSQPVLVVIRRLGDNVLRGDFASTKELALNFLECSARAAAPNPNDGSAADSGDALRSADWSCDADAAAKLRTDVKFTLEGAARRGDNAAKLAYGELIISDVLEAVMALDREKAAGRDVTTAESGVALSKTAALAYLKSGILDEKEAKTFIDTVGELGKRCASSTEVC